MQGRSVPDTAWFINNTPSGYNIADTHALYSVEGKNLIMFELLTIKPKRPVSHNLMCGFLLGTKSTETFSSGRTVECFV